MKFKIFKFRTVRSTNDTAIDLIKEKKKESGYVYAYKQTKGRGTHGKKWISSKGNLFGSIFFPLKKNFPPFNEFSIINPVIIYDVIENFCKKENISFKWPNDVFVNGKKICGILQEVVSTKKERFLIIGIGLNIISNPNLKKKYMATNILSESKKKPTKKEVLNLIISSYKKFFYHLNSYNYKKFKKRAEFINKFN